MAVAQRFGAGHRVLVSGGAGFVPSHLVDALIARGCDGRRGRQLRHRIARRTSPTSPTNPRFTLVEADVSERLPDDPRADRALRRDPAHGLAGQPHRLRQLPMEILRVGSLGTLHLLDRAVRRRRPVPDGLHLRGVRRPAGAPAAGELLGQRQPDRRAQRLRRVQAVRRGGHHGLPPLPRASTRRSCGSSTRTARGCAPTTAGPSRRSSPRRCAASRSPCTAPATQTRSICYVDDLVRGILLLLDSTETGPINCGTEHEMTMRELAELIVRLTGSESTGRSFTPRAPDDPEKRRPDLTLARTLLGYEPRSARRRACAARSSTSGDARSEIGREIALTGPKLRTSRLRATSALASATMRSRPYPGFMSATTSSAGGSSGRAAVPGAPSAPSGRTAGRAACPARRRAVGRGRPPYRQRRRWPGRPRRPGSDRGRAGAPGKRGRKPRWGRIALVAGVALALLGLLGAGGALYGYANKLDDDLKPHRPVLGDHRRPPGRRRSTARSTSCWSAATRGTRTRRRRGQQVARRHDHRDAHPGQPRQGVPGLDPARPVRADPRVGRAPTAATRSAQDQRGVRVGRAAAGGADRRGLHRRAHGPRDGDRLRRLQGGHRRARRRRHERGADDHLDPQAVPHVQEGHRTTSTAPRRSTTSASATSSRTATSPACGTSRSS